MVGEQVELNGRVGIIIGIRQDAEGTTWWLIAFDDCCTREVRARMEKTA